MTVAGLRRERDRNRLVTEMVAGKEYTTLADIKRMRELCRVPAKALDSGSDRHAAKTERSSPHQSGSSKTMGSISPQDALRARLERDLLRKPSEHSPTTSRTNTRRCAKSETSTTSTSLTSVQSTETTNVTALRPTRSNGSSTTGLPRDDTPTVNPAQRRIQAL